MNRIVLSAALAALCFLPCSAVAQVAPKTARVVKTADNDNTGVLPLTMQTPLGEAKVIVFHDWASVWIAGVQVAVGHLSTMPLLPGMQDATVDGHLCDYVLVTLPGGGSVLTSLPLPASTAGTLAEAVATYKETIKEAGEGVHACENDGGGTGT